MKIVDYARASALPFSWNRPSELANSSGIRDYLSGARVHRKKVDKRLTSRFAQQFDGPCRESGRLDDSVRNSLIHRVCE